MPLIAFTDYPILEECPSSITPIRQVYIIEYNDFDDACWINFEGSYVRYIKRAFLYKEPGRFGEVDCYSVSELKQLLSENV